MRRTAALLVVLSWSLAACGGGDDAGTETASDEDAGTMTRALSLVPDDEANAALVLVNDYAAAGEALGIDRPPAGEGADEDEVADWFIQLTVGRDDTVGGLNNNSFFADSALQDEAWRDELGWAPIDVDIAVEVPPNDEQLGYYAFIGDFDQETIDDAVTDDDNPWADELERDGDLYVWGDDPGEVDPDRITPVRDLGRGGVMAVLDEHTILWAWEQDAVEDGVAAATGDEDSLADSDELGPLAEAMDDADAMGGLFSADAEQFEGGDDPKLEPYESFATGVRVDDEPEVLVTLLHEDDDTAEANVDAMEEVVDDGVSLATQTPWSDLFDFEEATTDGPVTTAVLSLDDTSHGIIWSQLVFTRDSLLAT